MTVDPFTAYALSVRSGETIAGRLVCLACERHLRDRENAAAKGWRFDEATVRKAVGFFEHLHHSRANGPASRSSCHHGRRSSLVRCSDGSELMGCEGIGLAM
jgi:hypothetical protein